MRLASMTRGGCALALGVCLLVGGIPAGGTAVAQEDDRPPLPYSDDRRPPAPLPVPLDRHFRGELLEFDGKRVRVRWDWSDPTHLEDFDAFVPVRSGLRGGFRIRDGVLVGSGTGGIRLRLGMLSDIEVKTDAKLVDPHDLGIVLCKPDVSDESILCLIQDRFFTRFDAGAGNTNMINKMGGIPSEIAGTTEFRYVNRRPQPKLARGDEIGFEVVRSGAQTSFTILPKTGAPVTLSGKDPDTAMERFTPGLYVSSGAADFGPLEIEGAFDPEWCAGHDVLPHVASDLLHRGNGFKGKVKTAAARVEAYLSQGPDTPEKKIVNSASVAELVGQEDLPLVIRMRAAESLTEKGMADGSVVDRIAELLDAKDRPARLLAWQVLRPQLPWHFNYNPDGTAAERREGAMLVGYYLRERDDALAQSKVFVEGYWYTERRADDVRGVWERAWDIRSPRVRVRTNLPHAWALWYHAALEAGFEEMVRVVGHPPPDESLPLSVLVFRSTEDYETFCTENGHEKRVAWGRFVDLEKNVAFVTFTKKDAPLWSLQQMSKLFLRRATGRYWPTWYDEGRSSWFGNPSYKTATWNGSELEVGRRDECHEFRLLRAAAHGGDADSVSSFLARDPRTLDTKSRRLWYVQAWALHHFLMGEASEDLRGRMARWVQAMEEKELSPREVDAEGRRVFLAMFAGKMEQLETDFLAFLKQL